MPTVWVPDVSISLDTMTCGECGITFAVPASFKAKRMEDRRGWFCPNGHQRHFVGQTEAEKLRDELARERANADQVKASRDYWVQQHNAKERSLRATKAVVTRTKKKIVAGRCPCCSHQFRDLKTHMMTRHPKYDPVKAATALEAKV
jgi:hypothetical protein